MDDLLEELILRKLETLVIKTPARTPVGYQDLLRVEQQIMQVGLDYDEALIGRKEWLARRAPLDDRLNALRAKMDAAAEQNGLVQFADVNARDRWADMILAERRAVTRLLLDAVIVQPGVRGAHAVDLDRVQPVWRKSAAR